MRSSLALLLPLVLATIAIAQVPPRKPKLVIIEADGVPSGIALPDMPSANAGPHFSRAAAIELFEDEARWFATQLVNGPPAEVVPEFNDCYSGVGSIKVTGPQRFMETIKGWNFPIVEKPRPGEYRYIRFAWKKCGGAGIMVQFHDRHTGIWERRYTAGNNSIGYPAISVAAASPDDWTVVTRDLFADFNAFTITGMALTPMNGAGGLFDHIYLGRSIEDLDKITKTVREQPRRQDTFDAAGFDKLWEDLSSSDAAIAQPALSRVVSAGADSLTYIKKRLVDLSQLEGDAELLALIAELDHPRFAVRAAASRKLERLGPTAVAALKSALPKAASFEVFTRIEQLLNKPGLRDVEWSPRELRVLRLTRALEQMEVRESCELLKGLPFGSVLVEMKEEGRLALERLEKRLH